MSLFYYVLLCAHSSFAIILKRKLVALLLLSNRCNVTINVLLFLTVPWGGLQYVIMVFPDHSQLLFVYIVLVKSNRYIAQTITESGTYILT